jgi:hypothetical protein
VLVTANFKAQFCMALQGAVAVPKKWKGLPHGTKRPVAAHQAANW